MPTNSIYDKDKNTVTAAGSVQLFYQGRVLQADKVIYDRAAKRVYADGHAKMTDEHGNIIYGTPVRAQRRFSRRIHRQRPGSDKRQDALHLAAHRAFDRRHHRTAEWRLYRLRAVQGPSGTAAVLAGAGDQDHREPRDAHDLLRERSASVLGRFRSSGSPIFRRPTRPSTSRPAFWRRRSFRAAISAPASACLISSIWRRTTI